jgi:hypothetical protein
MPGVLVLGVATHLIMGRPYFFVLSVLFVTLVLPVLFMFRMLSMLFVPGVLSVLFVCMILLTGGAW